MPEADVLYCDVMFTKTRENAKAFQQVAPNSRSKVTPERVSLLVLSVLLIAALIGLGVVSSENFKTKETIKNMKDEIENMTKNLTDELCLKCEEGWELHGGKCYYFSVTNSSWHQSRDECRHHGGDLVKIDSREEQKFLEERLREKMNHDEDRFWIGLTDSEQEDTWLWADGSPLDTSLTFWSSGEPSNWTGESPDGEDCARMGQKKGADDLKCWFDRACTVRQRRICEKSTRTGLQPI